MTADTTAGDRGDRTSTAERVADAALAVPGVTELHGGLFGEVATYLPGGRVPGVALRDEDGEVHIIADVSYELRDVAAQVRDAAERITGFPMVVTVEDIAMDAASATNGAAGNE